MNATQRESWQWFVALELSLTSLGNLKENYNTPFSYSEVQMSSTSPFSFGHRFSSNGLDKGDLGLFLSSLFF